MKSDLLITVDTETGMIYKTQGVIGVNNENSISNIVFEFKNGFVDGTAWLEVEKPSGTKGYILMTKEAETYTLPIKNSLLDEKGNLYMQLRITKSIEGETIPVFKSTKFYVKVLEAINSTATIPEEYPDILDILNTKINDVKVDGSSVVDSNRVANIDLSGKVDKEVGKGLSTNDYTNADKTKVGVIQTNGTGDKYLSNDGTYKTVQSGGGNVDDVKVNGTSVVVDKVANVTVPTNTSELNNNSGFINKNVNDLTNYTKTSDLGSLATKNSVNYETEVTNKPTIPTKTSDLTNDSGFIDNTYHDVTKVDKEEGKSLSTNDYTTAEKNKLAGLNNYDDTEVRGLIANKQDIMQYSTMPTASASTTGKIVEYVGTTDSNYTKGYFYESTHTSVQESITATQTDNVVPLGTITLNNSVLKSQLNAGTHEFYYRPYDTVLNFMNLTAFPPVSYQVTRDNTFDRQPMIPNAPKLYSWVDNSNNFYATDTLQPNALTKLYLLDITTNDLTDTGATFIGSNTPSQIEGRWTKKEGDVYTNVELSDYGILLSSAGLPGNTIQVNYVEANDTYQWEQKNVQPASSGGSEEDNVSITKNASNKIQTVGVIDGKTSNADKMWTGTLAEYNALATKDNDTFYFITDDSANNGVPAGGTTGQVLTKNSGTDYDFSWQTLPVYNGGVE